MVHGNRSGHPIAATRHLCAAVTDPLRLSPKLACPKAITMGHSLMMRSILVGILVLMAAGIGWLTFDWYRSRYGGEPFGAPFTLVDQKGAPITEAAFRGHPSVVFFGFTHCPEVCPTTLFELSGWLKTMGDSGKNLNAYFVTVDPERDTPETMNAYVSNFSDRITGITGDPEKVHAMAKAFGIYWKKVDTGDGDYTMDHTASVLLLNAKGDFAGTIAYGESADTAVAKLKRLAAGGQT
jgi:protein SCO1/2